MPELVTFAEIARRLNARAILPREITPGGVRHIAETDPAWPVPRDSWFKVGNAWAFPWEPVEAFFRERKTRGRGPARKTDGSQ